MNWKFQYLNKQILPKTIYKYLNFNKMALNLTWKMNNSSVKNILKSMYRE